MYTVIGLDLGHSAVKMVVYGDAPFRDCFPSIACPFVEISNDPDARKAADDTIEISNSQKLFVGDTAVLQRNMHHDNEIGLHSDWITSSTYEALFRAALKKAERKGNDLSRLVIVHGLPAKDYLSHREALRSLHDRICPQAVCIIHAQPRGLFYSYLLDEAGNPVPHHKGIEETWCLLDVGHFTVDYGVMNKGNWIEPASGSTLGVSEVIKNIAIRIKSSSGSTPGPDIKLQKIQEALESGRRPVTVKYYGKVLDITDAVDKAVLHWHEGMLQTVFNSIKPYLPDSDGVLLSGGGASLILPLLMKEKEWEHLMALPDSRFTVADGFCRIGIMAAERKFNPETQQA